MKEFLFQMPTRIQYGEGTAAKIGNLVRQLVPPGSQVMLVTGPRVSKNAAFGAIVHSVEESGMEAIVFDQTVPEPPVAAVDCAAEILRKSGAKLVVAVGGGSPIDTAKAMAMLATNEGSIQEYLFGGSKSVNNPPLPLIAVPTTAGSGSEVTAAAVVEDTERGVKLSITHESLIPRWAVIDPLMHESMPPSVTAATGMDALTHAIEAYVSKKASVLSDMYAETSIRLIGEYLRTAVSDGENRDARGHMALASTLGAAAFLNGGLGAVHGISQSLGGVAHVSHGATNAVMLPHVMRKNLVGSLYKFAQIAHLLGEKTEGLSEREAANRAVSAVEVLSADIGIPGGLSEMGVRREMFDEVVQGTMGYRLLAMNPVGITERDVYTMLESAM